MLTKEFNIKLDMNRTLDFAPFEVVQGDTGNILHILLENDGEAMVLTGCSVCIVFASSKGFAIQDLTSGVALGEDAGSIDVTLYPASYGAGDVRADIQVYSGEENATLITSRRFTFRCRTALINEEIIRANATYPPLIAATQAANAAAAAALAAAAQNGEVNVQPDWLERDADSDAFIQNKPESFPPAAHAASHGANGSDPITPESIGAMAADATAADIGAATPAQLGSRSILHNGDWGHALVNQRARSGAVSNAYCIDRWIGSGTVKPVSGQHVTLAAGTVMTQRLEILPAALAGREMTFSIDVGGTVQTANIPFPASVTAAAATAALTDVSVSLGFHDLGSGNSSLLCGVASRYIPFVRLTAGAAIHVRRVFLEPGSVSTMENTLPQDYAAELARCERYYRILPANVFFGLATSSTSAIQGVVPYEQEMRASGTASCASTETLVYSGIFAFVAASSATVFTSLVQGLEIVCTVTPASCTAYRYTGLAFNAPILISSDL